jgi:hypothetical protein
MQTDQQCRLERLARIPSFLDDYALELGAVRRSPPRIELDAVLYVLTERKRAQADAAAELRSCTLRAQALRRELFSQHLRPIAAIARAELAQTPVAEVFRCPDLHANHGMLLGRAEAMRQEAARYRHLFLRHGLARDFVKQLRGAIDAMDCLAYERSDWMYRHVAATAELAAVFRRASQVVSVLDALVRARARGNRALLTAWIAVRRGEVVGGRPMSLAS